MVEAELERFDAALNDYADDELGAKFAQLRGLISRTILSLSPDGYRIRPVACRESTAEDMVRQLVEGSSLSLRQIFEVQTPG